MFNPSGSSLASSIPLSVASSSPTSRAPERSQGRAGEFIPSSFLSRGRRALSTPVVVNTGVTPVFFNPSCVVVGSVAFDWLSLTTFDNSAYRWLASIVNANTDPKGRTEGYLMQYKGCKGDGYFVGCGYQNGTIHYMIRLSGSLAHHILSKAVVMPSGSENLAEFNCTRADVQYTHSDDLYIDLSAIAPLLRECEWPLHRGKRPIITAYDNEDGLDTLYIGQRKESNRFQRVYIKEVSQKKLIRWEVEYKEQLAKNLWSKVIASGSLDLLGPVLAAELAVVPLPPSFNPLVEAIGVDCDRLTLHNVKSDDESRMAWLESAVTSACRSLEVSSDPKIRDRYKAWLELRFLGESLEVYTGPDRSIEHWVPDLSLDLLPDLE